MLNFDGFEWNKIAGAVLGSLLVVFGVHVASGFVYESEKPEKPGFIVEVPVVAEGGAAATPVVVAPISERLVTASAEKGAGVVKLCLGCHSLDSAGTNKTGPGLWGVVGRKIGTHQGFPYSPAFEAKTSETWTAEALDAFLANPKGYIPDTKMSFSGVPKPDKRADLIAYLKTLSDTPPADPTQ